jgi:hypothetical protein
VLELPSSAGESDQAWGLRTEVQSLLFLYTDSNVMEMQLDAREVSLVNALRRLPPETVAELSALAERLAALALSGRIDWSDSWSDEDLREFRSVSLKRLEAEETE